MREFDLNIEKVLENWSVPHAIREIIANALDEQILTKTKDIQIYQDGADWHIRDFGRGLRHVHLTQNENEEKLSHPQLIGKFGVGLKDALATFDRNHVKVIIDSKYGHITIGKSQKHGFSDLVTLHAYIDDPISREMEGTDFCLSGCTADDINEAKKYFLRFSDLKKLESTDYGEIYDKCGPKAEIFINGIKVSEEDNFLFSYNITSLNSALRKALNRERTNVGRSAYSDRVRSILLNVKSEDVVDKLTDNLTKLSDGKQCDEMKWIDVQTHVVKLLNSRKDTVFVTPEEIKNTSGSVMEIIHDSGKKAVFVPETVREKIVGKKDDTGKEIATIQTVIKEYNNSFEYEFISYEDLDSSEKEMMDLIPSVIELMGSKMEKDRFFVTERFKADTEDNTLGLYEREENRIIILRKQLSSREAFLGTVIHELTHADSGWPDVSRLFEHALTVRLGKLADMIFSLRKEKEIIQQHYREKIGKQISEQKNSGKVDLDDLKNNTDLSLVDAGLDLIGELKFYYYIGYYTENGEPKFFTCDYFDLTKADGDIIYSNVLFNELVELFKKIKECTVSMVLMLKDNGKNYLTIPGVVRSPDSESDLIVTHRKSFNVNAPYVNISPCVYEFKILGVEEVKYKKTAKLKLVNTLVNPNLFDENGDIDIGKAYGIVTYVA